MASAVGRGTGWLALLAGCLASCTAPKDQVVGVALDSARTRIAALELAAAQRDSLLGDAAAAASLFNEIDDAISRVRGAPRGRIVITERGEQRTYTSKEYRGYILARIDSLQMVVQRATNRAAALRPAGDSARDQSAQPQVDALQRTLLSYTATIERQRREIMVLTEQVRALTTARDEAVARTTELEDTVLALGEANNTVYVLFGTKSQLLELGVIEETGGARNFLMRRRGSTLVPTGRNEEGDFTALSRTTSTEIRMPRADRPYRVLTRQPADAAEGIGPDRVVRGTLRITDLDRFWAASRFLILLEEGG